MEYLIFFGCLLAIIVIAKVLAWPIKLIWKLVFNVIIGGILLYIINIVGAAFNISIAINWVSALVAGLLGVPGVILLLILQFIF